MNTSRGEVIYMLLLAEQLFLLSIDPKTNRPYARASTTLPFSLSGALLAELMLDEKVVEKGSKLEVIDDKIEDPLLKETLEMMRLKDNKTAKYWVPKLKSNHKNLPRKVAEKLDNEEVGTVQDKRMLCIFPSYIYIFEHETFFKNRKEAFKLVLDKYKEQQPLEKEEEKIVVLMSLAYVSNLI